MYFLSVVFFVCLFKACGSRGKALLEKAIRNNARGILFQSFMVINQRLTTKLSYVAGAA